MFVLTAYCLAFVVDGIWMWFDADHQDDFNPYCVKAVGIAGIICFGLCGIVGTVKLFDTKPGLIIDTDGIIDNSSGVSAGRIPWSDVTGITVTNILGQRLLTIAVIDPQKYVGRPINITSNALKIRFDELHRLLIERFEQHKRASGPKGDTRLS